MSRRCEKSRDANASRGSKLTRVFWQSTELYWYVHTRQTGIYARFSVATLQKWRIWCNHKQVYLYTCLKYCNAFSIAVKSFKFGRAFFRSASNSAAGARFSATLQTTTKTLPVNIVFDSALNCSRWLLFDVFSTTIFFHKWF